MTWFRYVRLGDVGTWLAKGWTIDDDMADCHHGQWSVLMIWTGAGEPTE